MNAPRRWLRSLPIRAKLMLFAGLACDMALRLAGIVLTIADYHSGRRALLEQLQSQVEITAITARMAGFVASNFAAAHSNLISIVFKVTQSDANAAEVRTDRS